MSTNKKEPVFTKAQLCKSNEFVQDQDIIAILMDDTETCTKSEIREQIKSFRDKEVR